MGLMCPIKKVIKINQNSMLGLIWKTQTLCKRSFDLNEV